MHAMSMIVANLLKICENQLVKWMKWKTCALMLNLNVKRVAVGVVVVLKIETVE
jgi:hypothetical protein